MRHQLVATVGVAVMAAPMLMGALVAPTLQAQSPPPAAEGLTFEVASVKPNKSGDNRVMMVGAPGSDRFTATNVTLRLLIQNAYQVQNFQMEGGPKWLDSDHFDIVAKMPATLQTLLSGGPPPGTGPGPLQFMLRSLLADRFKLAVHTEMRETPVYALVKARSDGKLGARITPSMVDCAALMRGRGNGPPPAPPAPGERPPCGMFGGLGRLAAGSVTMPQFAQFLSRNVNRVVVDRTGLTGAFDLDLDFTPEQLPPGPRPPDAPPLPPADGPSIYTALQEQLGLKLDSQKDPVNVLVIDHIEQPSED